MFRIILAFTFLWSQYVVASKSYLSNIEVGGRHSEYVIQNFPDERLMTVKLLGGVSKPGMYRIPEKTSVLTLLTYSGGLTGDADPEKMMVSGKKTSQYSVNEIMLDPNADFELNPEDTIFIDTKEQIVSEDTLIVITLVSTVLTVLLSAVTLSKSLE